MEYDAIGNVVSVLQANGGRVTAEYDALGRLLSETDALGHVTTETDALGNITSYAYNAESLLESITYANGGTVKAKYDLVGNLISETDPEGSKVI